MPELPDDSGHWEMSLFRTEGEWTPFGYPPWLGEKRKANLSELFGSNNPRAAPNVKTSRIGSIGVVVNRVIEIQRKTRFGGRC